MNEFEMSDYGIFSNGVTTIKTLNENMETINTDISECKTTFNNEAVFMGPICDSCLEGFGNVNSKITTMKENFSKIGNYLVETSSNYKASDDNASQLMLTIDSKTGKVETTTGAVASAYLNPSNISGPNLDFINSIKDGAVQAYNEYGVLPSLTMAQAILESGWGKSSIGNNIFGIKAGSGWKGKTINCRTSEQNANGTYYQINADFRDYDSVDDSIVDHAVLLTQDRYKPVLAAKNYKDACVAVRQCGYATSLSYSQNLISLVEQYGLDQWDPK